MRRFLHMLGAAIALSGGGLRAQVLRGVVRDSASHQPIVGAVVTAKDSAGVVVGRGISAADGVFRVVNATTARQVQVVRMGYRPVDLSAAQFHASSTPLAIAMLSLPTMLSGVTVTGADACPRRADRAATAALLDQARAGLLATVVAREANPASVVRLAYERELDANGQQVIRQKVRMERDTKATVSFNAAHPAADLTKRGFMLDSAGVQTYFGPDADVLLDEGFAASYCFHLAAATGDRPSQVGIVFEPRTARASRVDITGTLWVDTAQRVLRDVEFGYRGVHELSAGFGAGGEVSFREVSKGVVLVDRWRLRLVGSADTVKTSVRGETTTRGYAVREFGGELARAEWTDGRKWSAPLGALHVDARTHDGTIAPGTIVTLLDTDYRGITDSLGQVVLADLIPGPYALGVVDRQLAPLGVMLPTDIAFTAARDSTARARLDVPTAEDFVSQACRADGRTLGPAWLVARVSSDDAAAPAAPGAQNFRWRVSRGRGAGWTAIAEGGLTGGSGLINLCRNLAMGETVRLEAWRAGETPSVAMEPIREKVTALRLQLPRTTMLASRETPGPAALVRGTVTDSLAGTNVSDAFIEFAGTPFAAFTDSAGRFAIDGVPPGDYEVMVRTPALDSLGAVHRDIAHVRGTAATLPLRLPAPAQLAAAMCGVPASGLENPLHGVIVGRLDGAGREQRARVVAEWSVPATSGAPRIQWTTARTDENGTYRLCGLPEGVSLTLRAEFDSASAFGAKPRPALVPRTREMARADLSLELAEKGPAVFTGVVVGDSAAPVAGAEIAVDGMKATATTDEKGRFRIVDVPAGMHRVQVKRGGYGPLIADVAFGANQSVDHQVELSRVTTLGAVSVTESRNARSFDEHKKTGLGAFLTRETLEKFEGRTVADAMSMMPGPAMYASQGGRAWLVGKRSPAHLAPSGCGGAGAASGCGLMVTNSAGQTSANPGKITMDGLREQGIYCPTGAEASQGVFCACYMQVYVDGRLVNNQRPTEPFDANSLSPGELEGVEIYNSPASTPAEYSNLNAKCGVAVFWTRRGP